MTKQELHQAFSYKFSMNAMNFRLFEQETEDWTNEMNVTESGDDYSVIIDTEEERTSMTLTAEQLVEKINNEGWALADYNDEQKEEMEFQALPEVDPISETTYTTKSGYVMKMYALQYYADKSQWYEIAQALKQMRGWQDKKSGCYMLRSRQDAERLIEVIDNRK